MAVANNGRNVYGGGTPQMEKHLIADFTRIIQNKAELYEAAVRNGFYLPKLKSSIVTEEYITQVINLQIYCPLYKDIRLLPCPRPPDKETLIGMVLKHCKDHQMQVGITDQHVPDKKWLLDFVSTYVP